MVAFEVDVIPPQCTRFLGPDAYQEAQDNVGVQAVRPRRPDQGNGLLECERLGRAAPLADGCVQERSDVAAHLVVGFGVVLLAGGVGITPSFSSSCSSWPGPRLVP